MDRRQEGIRKQKDLPLVEGLKEFAREKPAYFCIPGHRYEKGVSEAWLKEEERAFLAYDITEVQGMDDLHQPSGRIKDAQDLLSDLYGSDHSWFLVNGTTGGNQAMLLSVLNPGDKVILARNSHKSALMGLIMAGGIPVWAQPVRDEESGLLAGLDPLEVDRLLEENPDCKAVMAVSPNYYGILADIKALSAACHKRRIPLLVDEAHGSHLYFTDKLPAGALQEGADLVSQSFHKVLGALGQASVLHMKSDLVDATRVGQALQLVQSTSPSYLLMASLDAARYEMGRQGKKLAERGRQLGLYGKKLLERIPGTSILGESLESGFRRDVSRLVFSLEGYTGDELRYLLRKNYQVELEMADDRYGLAVVTFANEREDLHRLAQGVSDLERSKKESGAGRVMEENGEAGDRQYGGKLSAIPELPPMAVTPREAWFMKKDRLPMEEARGKIAGEMIAVYPPGIPLLCPGEVITEEILAVLKEAAEAGRHIHGPEDGTMSYLKVLNTGANDL